LDTEIMAYAATHGYTVLTQDLDFNAILAATHGEKPSVVQIRSDNLDPDVIGAQVIDAVRKLETELDAGALVSIEPARTRVGLLPLKPKNLLAQTDSKTYSCSLLHTGVSSQVVKSPYSRWKCLRFASTRTACARQSASV
jgi:hypothetical protein